MSEQLYIKYRAGVKPYLGPSFFWPSLTTLLARSSPLSSSMGNNTGCKTCSITRFV